jgi:hypothetical protein
MPFLGVLIWFSHRSASRRSIASPPTWPGAPGAARAAVGDRRAARMQPLVHALNGLLRLSDALAAQRASLPTAHELRTPLDRRAPAGAARRPRHQRR